MSLPHRPVVANKCGYICVVHYQTSTLCSHREPRCGLGGMPPQFPPPVGSSDYRVTELWQTPTLTRGDRSRTWPVEIVIVGKRRHLGIRTRDSENDQHCAICALQCVYDMFINL